MARKKEILAFCVSSGEIEESSLDETETSNSEEPEIIIKSEEIDIPQPDLASTSISELFPNNGIQPMLTPSSSLASSPFEQTVLDNFKELKNKMETLTEIVVKLTGTVSKLQPLNIENNFDNVNSLERGRIFNTLKSIKEFSEFEKDLVSNKSSRIDFRNVVINIIKNANTSDNNDNHAKIEFFAKLILKSIFSKPLLISLSWNAYENHLAVGQTTSFKIIQESLASTLKTSLSNRTIEEIMKRALKRCKDSSRPRRTNTKLPEEPVFKKPKNKDAIPSPMIKAPILSIMKGIDQETATTVSSNTTATAIFPKTTSKASTASTAALTVASIPITALTESL